MSPDRSASADREPGDGVRRILVAYDEPGIRAALADYFSTLGYAVDTAGSPVTAAELLDRFQYLAVVTDLRLSADGDEDGLDVVRHARAGHPGVACIVLTAYGDPGSERRAACRGANAFFQKPAPLPLIAGRIAEILSTR